MTSIFVAKLDFNTTDEQLKSLFDQYGKVNRVTIAKDRETGKPRGFAFVEMLSETEADAAIEALDNTSVNGRTIAVKKADDRGSKPGGNQGSRPERSDRPQRHDGNNRFENRPPRTEGFSPRPQSDERPPYKKPDEGFAPRPSFEEPAKPERKKEKLPPKKSGGSDQPKEKKMEAYKKSGKANRFLDFEDDDDEDWVPSHRRNTGWDEEE